MKTGDEKARYIVREIRNIRSYRRIIDDLNREMKNNEQMRRELQEPHSPLGSEKVAPTVSPDGIEGILMESHSMEQNWKRNGRSLRSGRRKRKT